MALDEEGGGRKREVCVLETTLSAMAPSMENVTVDLRYTVVDYIRTYSTYVVKSFTVAKMAAIIQIIFCHDKDLFLYLYIGVLLYLLERLSSLPCQLNVALLYY